MAIILRTPDKKIYLTKEELSYFIPYLDTCKHNGFSGVNHYRSHEVRETLIRFSLTTFCEKVLSKWANNMHQLPSKKINLTVNQGEEISLIAMFQRVECGSYLLSVQQRILLSLRPLNSVTEI